MAEITLSDYIAICETKARYCRMLDSKDWDGFADVFTADLVLDTTPSGGYKIEGRDVALKAVRGSIETAKTAHQVHSPEIRFHGDSADVIWAMQDRVVWPADRAKEMGVSALTGYGQYHEHYVRCPDGRWRIKRQVLTRFHIDMDKEPAA